MTDTKAAEASHESTPQPPPEAMIDPELADLPVPSRGASESAPAPADPETNNEPTNNNEEANGSSSTTAYPYSLDSGGPATLGITESIAQAPNPRPSDFNYTHIAEFPPSTLDDIDYDAIANDGGPGSPTTKVMRAVVPHNAAQAEPKWPPVSEHLHITYMPTPFRHSLEIRLDATGGGTAIFLLPSPPRVHLVTHLWLFH